MAGYRWHYLPLSWVLLELSFTISASPWGGSTYVACALVRFLILTAIADIHGSSSGLCCRPNWYGSIVSITTARVLILLVALSITWKKASKVGCIAGAVAGIAAGITAWLVTTSSLNNKEISVVVSLLHKTQELTVDSLFTDLWGRLCMTSSIAELLQTNHYQRKCWLVILLPSELAVLSLPFGLTWQVFISLNNRRLIPPYRNLMTLTSTSPVRLMPLIA